MQLRMILIVCLLPALIAYGDGLDGGFEQVSASGQPAAWKAHPHYAFDQVASVQRDAQFVRSGDAAIRMVRQAQGFGHLYTRGELPVHGEQTYTFSYWAKGHGSVGAWVYLYRKNENGDAAFARSTALSPTKDNPADQTVTDDGQWHQFSYTFELDEQDAAVRSLRPVLLVHGNMVIDDVHWAAPDDSAADAPGAPDESADQRAATRTNVAAVAKRTAMPVIDGRMHPDEYTLVGTGLMDREASGLYPRPATYGFSHDGKRLYFGFSVQLPPGYAFKSARRERDDAGLVATSDALVLMLRSDDAADAPSFEGTYLVVTSDGALYDAWEKVSWSKGYCYRDTSFNAGWQVRTREHDGAWTVEMSVPLDDVKFDGDGLISFGLNLRGQSVTWQLHPNWFDHPQAFGRLRLLDSGPAVRVANVGQLARGEAQPEIELTNPAGAPIGFATTCLISTPRMVGGRIGSYIFDIAMDVREKRMASDRSVWLWEQKGEISGAPGGEQRRLADTHRLKTPGSYLMELDIRAGNDVMLYQMLPFRYVPPIEGTLTPVPSRELIHTLVSVRGAGPDERGRVRIVFNDVNNNAALTHEQAIDADEISVNLSMADLTPGDYKVRLELLNPNGDLAATSTQTFTKQPTPEWLTERAGIDALNADWVPDPWSPVITKGDTVEVWGRQFDFGGTGILANISSQKQKLLSAPMVVRYVVDGKAQTIVMTKSRIEQPGSGRVIVTRHGTSPHFNLEVRHTIEFDGMDRMDLSLSPRKPTEVEGVWVELPLIARPYSILSVNEGPGSQYWQRGLVNDALLDQPRAYNVAWFGDDDVGLTFFTENYRGWLVDSRQPRVTLTSKKQVRRLKLHLANVKTTVRNPMQVTFGLHPTPFKPQYDGWRATRPMGLAIEPPPVNVAFVHASIWNSADSKPSPRNWKVLEDIVAFTHERGQRAYPYLGTFFISPYDNIKPNTPFDRAQGRFDKSQVNRKKATASRQEEFFYHAEDWHVRPKRVSEPAWETRQEVRTAAGSTWSDYFAHGIEQMLKRTKVDGFYLDIANPIFDMNEARGLTVITLDGRREGSMELFATRDLYKRLYRIFEKHRGPERRPWLFGHGFACSVPYSPFWDVNFNCEEVKPAEPFEFTKMNLQRSLEGTPMATAVSSDDARNYDAFAWRAHFGEQFGLPNVVLPQYGYRPDLNTNEHSREMIAWTFIHNNMLWPAYIPRHAVYDFWSKVEEPFGMGDTVFHPYWRNEVKASPQSVRVSWWEKRDASAALLAAVNWSNQPVEAVIDLPEPLRDRSDRVEMESGKTYPPGTTVKLTIPPHDIRVLRLR